MSADASVPPELLELHLDLEEQGLTPADLADQDVAEDNDPGEDE